MESQSASGVVRLALELKRQQQVQQPVSALVIMLASTTIIPFKQLTSELGTQVAK